MVGKLPRLLVDRTHHDNLAHEHRLYNHIDKIKNESSKNIFKNQGCLIYREKEQMITMLKYIRLKTITFFFLPQKKPNLKDSLDSNKNVG